MPLLYLSDVAFSHPAFSFGCGVGFLMERRNGILSDHLEPHLWRDVLHLLGAGGG